MTAERLIDGMRHDPFSESLDIHYEVLGEGRVRSVCTATPRHRNALGVTNGALLYAMADTGMGRALATVLGPAARCATIAATIYYIEPAGEGKLIADSMILNRGEKIATVRSEVRSAEGTVCAIAIGTFHVSLKVGRR